MRKTALLFFILSLAVTANATIFGAVRGIIHDPQHRPLQGAMVMLRSNTSDWAKTTNTSGDGEFEFNAVPWRVHSGGGLAWFRSRIGGGNGARQHRAGAALFVEGGREK